MEWPHIELEPKKGYVSLRRRKQLAMIRPTTTTRIALGLILVEAGLRARRLRQKIRR